MATVLFLIHLQNPDADEPSRDEIRPKDEAEKPKENELKVQDKDKEDVAQSSSQELGLLSIRSSHENSLCNLSIHSIILLHLPLFSNSHDNFGYANDLLHRMSVDLNLNI